MKKEAIIDIKNGNIYGKGKEETIILKGYYLHEDSDYVESANIIIKDDNNDIKEYPIKNGGYNLKLFVGNFSNNEKQDIFLYGDTGGSGGYSIAIIYGYRNGELIEIFNGESFSEKYKGLSKYLECYKIEVICQFFERRYILDISNIEKDYLKQIYNSDGKVITNEDPSVSYVNKVDLINNLENGLINLLIHQRIIGVNNSNTLGQINSVISLKDDSIKVSDKYISSSGESISVMARSNNLKEEILSKLPDDAILLNFNKFGGNNGVIVEDIDGDGSDEILCAYKSKDNQYLSAFREVEGNIKHIDTIGGEGYDISDLIISKIKAKCNNNILIGWRIGSIWSVLDILEFKENKFNKLLKGDKINYSKVEVVEFDIRRTGISDVVLWSHETGEAYKVQIYSFRGDIFEKTFKYDKEYFKKVEEYYQKLINRTRETPQYLYYLIDAEYRSGKRREAISNINKALKHPRPYPSLEELKRLRKRIGS